MSEADVGSFVLAGFHRHLGGRSRRDSSSSLSFVGAEPVLGVGAAVDCSRWRGLLVEIERLSGGASAGWYCLDAIDGAMCHSRGEKLVIDGNRTDPKGDIRERRTASPNLRSSIE